MKPLTIGDVPPEAPAEPLPPIPGEVVITGVRMGFGDLVDLFMKVMWAWLVAAVLLLLMVGIPVGVVLFVIQATQR